MWICGTLSEVSVSAAVPAGLIAVGMQISTGDQ